MNQDLALRVLSQIMAWSDERAREEFRWLRLMARLKYDGYRDFQAGMRFIENLATWLQQFEPAEREIAYGCRLAFNYENAFGGVSNTWTQSGCRPRRWSRLEGQRWPGPSLG